MPDYLTTFGRQNDQNPMSYLRRHLTLINNDLFQPGNPAYKDERFDHFKALQIPLVCNEGKAAIRL